MEKVACASPSFVDWSDENDDGNSGQLSKSHLPLIIVTEHIRDWIQDSTQSKDELEPWNQVRIVYFEIFYANDELFSGSLDAPT